MKNENVFQKDLIKTIKHTLPEAVVLKNDPQYIQGFPDLTILHGRRWAVLECKRSEDEPFQPNQEYYIHKLASMGFASEIHPGNRTAVLHTMFDWLEER